jgi:hypothetical protein
LSKLAKFFVEVIQGRRFLKASRDGKLFSKSYRSEVDLPAWGNARVVQRLAKSMAPAAYAFNAAKVAQLLLLYTTALECKKVVSDHRAIQIDMTTQGSKMVKLPQTPPQSLAPPGAKASSSSATTVQAKNEKKKKSTPNDPDEDDIWDAGVSDAGREHIQRDSKQKRSRGIKTVAVASTI